MGSKTIHFLKQVNNSKGQSMVEYILLFGVIMVLTFSVLNSQRFKDFFGENSTILNALRDRVIYSYRHGTFGEEDNSNYNGAHDTYKMDGQNRSRFFSPLEQYPK